jgi:aspartate racemase
MERPLHIGLIGGIGPAATVFYYQRLCAEMRARGARLELTIVQADTAGLIVNSTNDRRQEQALIYGNLILRLKAAGADCAAITSLGGHFCFSETQAISALPLISAIAPLDHHFAAEGLGAVGLLGTPLVMRTRLYAQLNRTRPIVLEDQIDTLGKLYLDMAISGQCTPATRDAFFTAGREMTAKGAEAILLAGTDLSLAFEGHDCGFRVIDALNIHVARLADLASGRAAL